jgi:hypothetical protein
MEKPKYTERDMVLKQQSVPELIEECSVMGIGLKTDALRKQLADSLERAKTENSPVFVEPLKVTAGWDDFHEEFYLVIPDVYDPRNLVAVLFERIISSEEDDPEEDLRGARAVIESYLGVIEEKEKISLRDAKEKLFALTADMKKALLLFEEEEYSEEEFDKLSEALDKAYFDPISELLEGVLVTIAGG